MSSPQDYSHSLQQFMQKAGIANDPELSQKAGVSELQIIRLRHGLALQTNVGILLKISHALNISLTELLAALTSESISPSQPPISPSLEQEYQQLQTQLERQRDTLIQEFQQSSWQILEPWMLQWPTAAAKAQEKPELSATQLLPLIKPIEKLLQQWGIEMIAPVGAQVPYEPQWHQLMEGAAQPGDRVKVRYTGYRQGNKLLYRAKVSPL